MMDHDLKYFVITVLILVLVAGIQNVRLSEDNVRDFGYCDSELYCAGFEAGGVCIGTEQIQSQCYEVEGPEHHRRVEAECGAIAYNICDDGMTGTEWADHQNATYRGTSCSQWADQKDVDLLNCDETFPGATEWKDIE